jgi:Ca-activated chloride channel family protein
MRTSHYHVFTRQNPLLPVYLFAVVLSAQTQPSFRSNVELVAIPCTVVDAHGVPVAGLTREEFRVFDNGTPRTVENLWFDTDLPLTLGVIIDASQSQREQFAEHRQTVLSLLERILRPGDRAFAISVDEEIRLWAGLTFTASQPFGQPCPKQQSNVPGARPLSTCGSSPLWNALYDAARLKLRPLTGNKAILILTDGFDSGSIHTWHEAVDEAHKSDAAVYAIQYPSAFGNKYAPDLYKLVTEAGGTWFEPPRGEYGPIVTRIETDLRRRYVLGFRPEKLSGKIRHDVRVEVIRPDLSVRARKVYFQVPQ